MSAVPGAPVRVDTASDPALRRTLALTLSRAFADDPHFNWIVRQDKGRTEALKQLFELLLAELLGHHGTVLASADLKAAAIWFPPRGQSLGLIDQIGVAWRFVGITGWRHFPSRAYGLNRMAWRQPDQPHYFLQTLGVDPDRQGYGYGTALLRAFTRQCDADRTLAYLETSKPDNVRFYEGHGFLASGRAKLPHGPWLWQMTRTPG
ncbi:MAG: GNAT family N-acetyltransferase [Thiobacillus sp.]|nr:GNAT family N-acetyltransferase [Thiobacillus sp.]